MLFNLNHNRYLVVRVQPRFELQNGPELVCVCVGDPDDPVDPVQGGPLVVRADAVGGHHLDSKKRYKSLIYLSCFLEEFKNRCTFLSNAMTIW